MENAARQWDEVAQHLVQAHGAAPDGLIGYTPTLEQLNFAHLDTHAALDLINARPPDGHTHAAPLDPGWCDPRPSSFRPFPPSASAGRVRTSKDPFTFPESCQTGLPHTGERPLTEADLRDWARTVAGYRVRDGYDAFVLDCIKDDARAAAARWLTRADFPRPVQAIRGNPPVRGVRTPRARSPRATRRR